MQQVESHLLKVFLVKLSGEINRRGLDALLVVCIHDSIWVEASVEDEREVHEIMEKLMTTAMNLSVPLSVDFEN